MGRCEDQASAMVQRRNHAAHDVVNLDAFSDFCILPKLVDGTGVVQQDDAVGVEAHHGVLHVNLRILLRLLFA